MAADGVVRQRSAAGHHLKERAIEAHGEHLIPVYRTHLFVQVVR